MDSFTSLPSSSYALATLLVVVYLVYRRVTRISIADIPGPEPESWILGNYRQFFQSQAGEVESQWNTRFGDVVRIKGIFGADRLFITDPKALQYIYNNSGYKFDKQRVRQELARLVTGRGVSWANGENHRRQRQVSGPAFGAGEARSYVPLFVKGASRLTEKWKTMIGNDPSLVISVPNWLSRATMDVIGEVAFQYEFNALFDDQNILTRRYQTIAIDTFKPPTSAMIVVQGLLAYFPHRLLQWLFDNAPIKRFKPARELAKLAVDIAKTLVEARKEELLAGDKLNKRDIISLLVRANAGLSKERLTDEEMWAMMMTVLAAGHETTSNTLMWGLQELAKQPKVQGNLRKEILNAWQEVIARGDAEFQASDFDKMKYTNAVVKEILRFYPVAYYSLREANENQVIPLSKPLLLKSGKSVSEIKVPKGMNIFTSPVIYNRNKDIFGQDAEFFNPDRWLDHQLDRKLGTVGIYGNMMTFGSGVRACIGWRFAVYEIQAFLIELIRNFKFDPTPELKKLRKEPCLVMVATLEGELDKGPQVPLRVSVVNPDAE